MKKFAYGLQGILDVKQKLEEQERTYYAIARLRLTEEEEKLSVLCSRRDQYEELLRGQVVRKLNILEIKRLQEAVEIMKYQIKIQMGAVAKAEQALELARNRLKKAMVERKTHETLKEKAFDIFKLEYDAQERKEIDELVSFTYGERARHGSVM